MAIVIVALIVGLVAGALAMRWLDRRLVASWKVSAAAAIHRADTAEAMSIMAEARLDEACAAARLAQDVAANAKREEEKANQMLRIHKDALARTGLGSRKAGVS